MTRRSLLLGVALAATAAVLFVVLHGDCAGLSPPGRSARTPVSVTVRAGIPVGGDPVAIAIGAGSAWIIDASQGTLSAIDLRTHKVRRGTARIGGGPFAVAVGEGAVWVASGDGTIRAFDPRNAREAGNVAHVPGANGLAAGAGAIWVTSRLARTVTRVDPRTRHTGQPIRVGAGPADIAVGAGSVWVANADAGTVTRIDPHNGRADGAIATGGTQVRALAVGEGGVWVARAGGLDANHTQIVQIDPRERTIKGTPIDVTGAIPLDIAAAAGSIWVTDIGRVGATGTTSDGHVIRIDPVRHKISDRVLRAGRHPTAIAVDAHNAWVANGSGATVTPISIHSTP